jgi:adenine-specific DNA-methyltransferase
VSNEIKALLERVESADPATAKALRRHIDSLQGRRQFGLNFERHTPESVALTGRPISVGDKVRFLPERGQTEVVIEDEDEAAVIDVSATWLVTRLSGPKGKKVAELLDPKTKVTTRRTVEDLVFVADFRDPIYPGLVRSGEPVLRGGDKPFHTVINAENYHALEAMLFTSRGKVDCIYIDPPYNTRANDWKYNNDYVDPGDSYAHSKWLAFMERRLRVARELLNPMDSVLIVTIDEKEYMRLGLLLEQVFPEARIQMVSIFINPASVARGGYFGRSDEYAFFVMLGAAGAQPLSLRDDWVTSKGRTHRGEVRWDLLRKSGSSPTREGHPETFYPFFVTDDGTAFHSVGEPIGVGASRADTTPPPGTFAVWPIRKDGSEGRWRLKPETVRKVLADGCLRLGATKGENTPIYYLAVGERAKVKQGMYPVTGHRPDGSIITETLEDEDRVLVPGTQWRVKSHDATQYGTRLLLKLLPDRKFPFPKSLYAVEDALRFFVADKPKALIVDFFAGSGTTAHAVMRLNHQDGGRRRSISVTNNEVNDEEVSLLKRGLRSGDEEWDSQGICERVTKPRIRAAVTGLTPGGEPIDGDYKFVDEFPMSEGLDENVEFFTLTYENPALVELDMAFERIAPLLWMRAGAQGRMIAERRQDFDVADTYAVLFSVDAAKEYLKEVAAAEGLRIAYIVTDEEPQFQAIAGQLPDGVESVRLYESYLRTFEINNGRA